MITIRTHSMACLLTLGWALVWGPQAQAVDGLSLSEALARALRDSPELRIYPYERRAAEADKLQAGLRPNPELGVELQNFAGTGAVRGVKSLETTLTLSQLIELGGKRERRVEAAEAALGSAGADYDVARLDVLSETARRYVDVAEAQAQLEATQRSIDLAKQAGEAVERRIRAGAASTAERNRANIARLRAQLDAQRAQGELDARRVALGAMWGQGAPDFNMVSGDLYAIPPLADFATFADRIQTSPDIGRFASERRLREAEVKLAQAEAVPDLTVGAGVRRLNSGAEVGGTGADYGLVASLNLPLPLFNRNQGKIAAAQERIGQSDAERDAALLRTRAVLYGLYQAAAQARRQSEALRGEAMTQAEQALTLTQRGFLNGRFSFLELADAQRQVLELRSQAITASADAQRIDAEIERLTAQPIVAATAGATP
ncbi:MAG: TolC family protein [Nevskia sp.]|nr:TolC family protein [Nevskia sp.]